jgi:hypothetical protein
VWRRAQWAGQTATKSVMKTPPNNVLMHILLRPSALVEIKQHSVIFSTSALFQFTICSTHSFAASTISQSVLASKNLTVFKLLVTMAARPGLSFPLKGR